MPAGTVRVKVFFTGLTPQTITVVVPAGQTVQQDVTLSAGPIRAPAHGTAEQPLALEKFVVTTSKEMDGAAIAITSSGSRATSSTSSPRTNSGWWSTARRAR